MHTPLNSTRHALLSTILLVLKHDNEVTKNFQQNKKEGKLNFYRQTG